MTGSPDPALRSFVEKASGPVLLLHDVESLAAARALATGDVATCPVNGPVPDVRGKWGAIALLTIDAASLRRAVSCLPRLGRVRAVACWLSTANHPLTVTPPPEWPPLETFNARLLSSGAGLTVLRTARPVAANAVFEALARSASRTATGGRGLVVAMTRETTSAAPPVDPGTVTVERPEHVSDPSLDVPPDVLLSQDRPPTLALHHVLGRAPIAVTDPDLLQCPLDEGLLNPIGFEPDPDHGMLDLGADWTPTPDLVAELRHHRGVQVHWTTDPAPALFRTVAGLAMAGVPLVCSESSPQGLDPTLSQLLTTPTDLTDPLHREEHSVRLRRAAQAAYSTVAWRERLASRAGLRPHGGPSVSVVMATKRPENLEFALRQITRQRNVDAELVLVTHGFELDPGVASSHLHHRLTAVSASADTPFGDVLNAGVTAASGDLIVKMDDDDWYGPDFLSDLLLARHYSGAVLTGMLAEFVYVAEADTTVRRRGGTERFADYVAGGTLMISRSDLRALGSFRSTRTYEDAALMGAVRAAGGGIYRTHGLGYVLRRNAAGHTWDIGSDYFLDPTKARDQWRGFTPSALLEADPGDLPDPGPATPGHGGPAPDR